MERGEALLLLRLLRQFGEVLAESNALDLVLEIGDQVVLLLRVPCEVIEFLIAPFRPVGEFDVFANHRLRAGDAVFIVDGGVFVKELGAPRRKLVSG